MFVPDEKVSLNAGALGWQNQVSDPMGGCIAFICTAAYLLSKGFLSLPSHSCDGPCLAG